MQRQEQEQGQGQPTDGRERLLQVMRSLACGPPLQQMLTRQVLRRRLPAPGLEETQAALHHQGGAGAAQGAQRGAVRGQLSRGCASDERVGSAGGGHQLRVG